MLPFAMAVPAIWLGSEAASGFAAFAVVLYGAVILSFLGGLAWGATSAATVEGRWELTHSRLLAASVVPPLIAWGAALLPPGYGLVVLALSFVGVLAIDRRLASLRMVPPWWMKLRRQLSLTVAALLLVAAFGTG
ncbi:MAG: DUF3429 domain-containing protein [Rhodospirillales bacterium]|nr:DUF3429 domain-containing protein [Rhodospirillales bacterium]